jgi:hypothetical protein
VVVLCKANLSIGLVSNLDALVVGEVDMFDEGVSIRLVEL